MYNKSLTARIIKSLKSKHLHMRVLALYSPIPVQNTKLQIAICIFQLCAQEGNALHHMGQVVDEGDHKANCAYSICSHVPHNFRGSVALHIGQKRLSVRIHIYFNYILTHTPQGRHLRQGAFEQFTF